MEETLISYRKVDICLDDFIVLKDVDFELSKGEFAYLIGKVGSGKSTLLKTIYAEVPLRLKDMECKEAQARVFDYDLLHLKTSKMLALRRELGIVFQDFKLLTDRSIHDNLSFVLKATGWKGKDAMEDRIAEVLRQVGMANKGYKMPHELSGGEQQRMVIARALLNRPSLILADEPTGNLDPVTSNDIVQLLHDINADGTTVLMTTHNLSFLEKFPGRVFSCENGKLIANQ